MDDSLEALLEKATNPKNRYEDWEFIMAFCDKVNGEPEGPGVALRIIVPKIQEKNEKVAMLALTLLEACVKNCGKRFHAELGKFRFLNELIRLLSPKYLGDTTPPAVQKRIKELLYSWKMGLPHEGKIQDAYEMLKREGLLFDESVGPDKTLDISQTKPKVQLIEDPKQSKMLQKLLSSKNPDDLRAANRLIRDMVRRDDKRMQRLQKRLDETELVQNNVKLLNELLSHYKSDSGLQEKQLIDELYNSLDKMRPSLLRMASELKDNEEGMSDILQTNDSVIRVMDRYKSIFGESPSTNSSSTANSESGAVGTTATSGTTTAATSAEASSGGAGGVSSQTADLDPRNDSLLIDLADLDLGSPPSSSSLGVSSGSGGLSSSIAAEVGGNLASGSGTSLGGRSNSSTGSKGNLGSLLDDLGSLTLPPTGTTAQNTSNLNFQMSSSTTPQLTQQVGGFPLLPPPPPLSTIAPPTQQSYSSSAPFTGFQPLPSTSTPPTTASQLPPSTTLMPASGLGSLDVFGLGGIGGPSLFSTVNNTQQAPVNQLQGSPGSIRANVPQVGGMGLQQLNMGMGPQPNTGVVQPQLLHSSGSTDPLAVLNDLFISRDDIQPGTLSPLQLMSKNGITISFHFAKNSPAPNVTVIVISIVSTSLSSITNFQFQAAVPKTMRVKLQPPNKLDLATYNPVQPPDSISQIMLLANPSKAKIRLRYRISYNQGGQEVVEIGEAAEFPAGL